MANTNTPTSNLEDLDDMILVERAVGGDFEAFTQIVGRYQDKAHRLAWSMMRDESEAQDVVQEAFLNIYRKLESFEGSSKLSSWIYRVVVNAALMRLRKRSRRKEVALDELSPSFDAQGHHEPIAQWRIRADEAAQNSELREQILAAIDELEPKYQAVFVLKEVEGLSLEEIAEMLDLSVPAVKSRLHRARLFLRTSLERYLS
ncbi:MAG: sigma-70 family RNA polymerase sigma factor [Bradymonadaceae bacterium]|nr:sigma-70 family RNA polymerase sigma factor [Lujinxingiaceae bacterium]